MKVKICGITSDADAAMCQSLGADMLGFVHFPGKIRSLPVEDIRDMHGSRGSVTRVLVCNPPDARTAKRMLEISHADVIQLCSLGPQETMSLRKDGINVMRMVKPVFAEATLVSCARCRPALCESNRMPPPS